LRAPVFAAGSLRVREAQGLPVRPPSTFADARFAPGLRPAHVDVPGRPVALIGVPSRCALRYSRSGRPVALIGVPSRCALRYSRSGRPVALIGVPSRCALRYSRSGRPVALMRVGGARLMGFPSAESLYNLRSEIVHGIVTLPA